MTLIADSAIDTLWYTRCPVPTASGLANSLGWLDRTANESGVRFGVLQDAGPELAVRHFDHHLSGLIREGGNVPRTGRACQWFSDEAHRAHLDRRGPGNPGARRLRHPRSRSSGRRSDRHPGLGGRSGQELPPRAMALHGFASALRLGELSFADVTLVEVATTAAPPRSAPPRPPATRRGGVESLLRGDVDAIYVKGARAQEVAREHGLAVAVDLDSTASLRDRVNNGTPPRPITVHADLLEQRPDIVVGFLAESLRAADWAAANIDEVRAVLQTETQSGARRCGGSVRRELPHRTAFEPV